jgi:hypothetical protein
VVAPGNRCSPQNITPERAAADEFLFGFAVPPAAAPTSTRSRASRGSGHLGSSSPARVKQSAKLETGVQAYFAYYNRSGGRTGCNGEQPGFDSFGNVVIASTLNRDASCVLTGVPGVHPTTTGGLSPAARRQQPRAANSARSSPGTVAAAFRSSTAASRPPRRLPSMPAIPTATARAIASTSCAGTAPTRSTPRARASSAAARACWPTSWTQVPPGSGPPGRPTR